MRLLCIVIVLVIFKRNYGEEETSTSTDLDKEIRKIFDQPVAKPDPCEFGECTPYYLCLNGTIITSGDGALDVRIGGDDDPEPERHPCPNFFDTCCSLIGNDPSATAFLVPSSRPDKCGVRNKMGVAFNLIEHDNEAQFAEFPWVVAIIQKVHNNDTIANEYVCSGSLIHPGVVITAAHCVVDLKEKHELIIRAGEWDTQTKDEPFPHQDRAVIDVLIHENYTRGSHFNNVALLFLDDPVQLAENVNTACLPPQDFVFDHQRCFAGGWGKDKFGAEGFYQVILKRIELPVVPHAECQSKLRDTRLGLRFKLDPSFMCAGGEPGKDTCQGDGGAPLNCEIPHTEDSQYYLAGEVAWGIGCFGAVPGVYVNVAKFRHWIDKIFVERNLEQKYYLVENEIKKVTEPPAKSTATVKNVEVKPTTELPITELPTTELPTTELPTKSNPCEVGECVPYYLCLNGTIITSGEGVLDVRIGGDDDPNPERHPCPDFFDTCCSLKQDPMINIYKPSTALPDKCGVRNKNGIVFNLLEHDNESQYAEFPWVVAIILTVHDNDTTVNEYKCSGSLIHPSVVITAAHCVDDLKEAHDFLIRAGEWDTQTKYEPFPHYDRTVADVLIHEHYDRRKLFNDVALLFLDKPVDLAENVNTACLPPQDFVFDHQRCFANGWGKDKFGVEGFHQVILKRIELPVVPHGECETKLRGTRLGNYFELDPSFICAGGESGRDTCQGDGGAPLSCEISNNENGQYYLAGEVAWGIGCFDPIPGVYVNVAKFRHWIDKIFEKRNLEQKYYIAS